MGLPFFVFFFLVSTVAGTEDDPNFFGFLRKNPLDAVLFRSSKDESSSDAPPSMVVQDRFFRRLLLLRLVSSASMTASHAGSASSPSGGGEFRYVMVGDDRRDDRDVGDLDSLRPLVFSTEKDVL